MITAFKLAGFAAAHAIWSVSDGETLIPFLAYTTESGKQNIERLIINEDLAASVDFGRRKLESNEMDAIDAALLFDGRISLDERKTDAVVIEIRTYFSTDSKATIAVPYTPQTSGGFRVHKPKLLEWEECEDFDMPTAVESFFEGIDEHEQGAEIWNNYVDESR